MSKSPPLIANIFSDPIAWAGTMVGTKARYIFSLIFLPFFILTLLNNISDIGLWENWSAALVIVSYNLMFMYSLRALYVRVKRLEGTGKEDKQL